MSKRFAYQWLLLTAGLGLWTSSAIAQEDQVPKPRPTAPDTRGGRPTLAGHIGWGSLFGQAERDVSQGQAASWGPVFGGQLAYPFSREWAIDIWGSLGSFKSGTTDCKACTAESFTVGAGGVYHLVDGLSFDPWFSAGIGYRQTKLKLQTNTSPVVTNLKYNSLEFLRIAIGSDYYPFWLMGFGPMVDFQLGRNLNVSPGSIKEGAFHWAFSFGFRVVLNPIPPK
jgi:hypothetical protein